MKNKKLNESEELEINRLLLNIEIIISWISIISFLGFIYVVDVGNLENIHNIIYIVCGSVIFIIGMSTALKIEQLAGYYKCTKCGHEEVPVSYLKVFIAPHIGRTRYMKCTKCSERSWHKKVLIKSKNNN